MSNILKRKRRRQNYYWTIRAQQAPNITLVKPHYCWNRILIGAYSITPNPHTVSQKPFPFLPSFFYSKHKAQFGFPSSPLLSSFSSLSSLLWFFEIPRFLCGQRAAAMAVQRLERGDLWKSKAMALQIRLRDRFRVAVDRRRRLREVLFAGDGVGDDGCFSTTFDRWLRRFRDFRRESLPSSSTFYRKRGIFSDSGNLKRICVMGNGERH